jgi:hypothetical protein
MRDLVQELQALEDDRPTTWSPAPGETLVGRVQSYETITGLYGACPAVIVAREEDGAPVTIWLSAVVLQSLFEEEQPQVGDRIGLRYLGLHPTKGYKRYALLVDREA